jgi:hypothetical protein
MPVASVTAVEIGKPADSPRGRLPVRVVFEDGRASSFEAAAPGQPSEWIKPKGFAFGPPTLFVATLDRPSIEGAVAVMAQDMGGYWLRYYNTPEAKPVKKSALKVASAQVTELYPPRKTSAGCAVAQAYLSDGREFSLLTATPIWFEKTFAERGLAYYYGPSVLFTKTLEQAVVKKAVKAMEPEGDRWLCLHDTPRTTLPEVLAQFAGRHPSRPG